MTALPEPELPTEYQSRNHSGDSGNSSDSNDSSDRSDSGDSGISGDMPGATAIPAAVWPRLGLGLSGGAVVLLAALASLFALSWASSVVVPMLLGLTFSYALTPIVNWLVRWHVPRALAAALLLGSIVGGIASVAWSLSDEAASMLETLPDVAQKIRRELAQTRDGGAVAAITQVQKAAAEIESAAANPVQSSSPGRVTRVQIEPARFDIRDYLWTGTLGLLSGLGYASVILFVSFFLLAAGDTFRRKLAKIAGPNFGTRRLAVTALDEINHHIQRYLLVQLFTSVVVGLAVWLSFWWLGVDNAAVWGVLGFVLNLIPYFGNVVLTGAAALYAFVQFGSVRMALVVGGAALLINVLESNLLTPWLTVRASRLNPVAVFVGVLAWGWLWGLGGLFLGMPILIAIKAICDRVEELQPVGEILGN